MHIYVTGNSKIYSGLHIKCSLFLSDFSQISIFLTDFYRNPPYKISQNLSSGSCVDTCGQMDRHNKVDKCFSSLCECALTVLDHFSFHTDWLVSLTILYATLCT